MRNRINGHRGAFQLVFAAVYLVVGISFVLNPDGASRQQSLRWLADLGAISLFGWLWIVAAVAATAGAFMPRPKDWFGFFMLVFAPAVWGGLFIIGVCTGANPFGLITAVIYWCFAAAPMIVSGMQGPGDRDHRRIHI
jgi:hypothetical protein